MFDKMFRALHNKVEKKEKDHIGRSRIGDWERRTSFSLRASDGRLEVYKTKKRCFTCGHNKRLKVKARVRCSKCKMELNEK